MMNYFAVFLKGIAMGAADVVPGVSGGTIAFITGIYTTLLQSITRVRPSLLGLLKEQGVAAAWRHINGNFLLALGSGILMSILSLAKLIHYLLAVGPEYLWSFFFGLILASCWYIGRQIPHWRAPQLLAVVMGAVIAAGVSLATPTEVAATLPVVFVAGSIAICAMILPGISGSFMLLLMGLYGPVMAAVSTLDLTFLGTLAAGAVLGLLLFSHLLQWLLHHYHATFLALLTGFMAGSLVKVWPWKETLLTRVNSHGAEVPFIQQNVLPVADIHLFAAVLLAGLGVVSVLILEKWAVKSH
tara:strand:+ start:914 stop:1813 length:900 start_codon:yes stop_codon:yes gene_type:complete